MESLRLFRASATQRLLAMKFAEEFVIIYALYTIMFGERSHISSTGIGIILAVSFIAAIALEIPTGVIADKIPRKYVLLLAIATKFIGFGLWLVWPAFWGYLLGAALVSAAYALESGSLQAYLYNTLGDDVRQKFGHVWARVSALIMVSYSTAYLTAALIGPKYELLISLTMFACAIAFVIGLSLPKDSVKATGVKPKLPRIFKSAVGHIFHTKALLKLLLSALVVLALSELMIEYASLYNNQIGVPTRYVPLVLGIGNIIGALLFLKLPLYENYLNKHKLIFTIVVTIIFIASFFGGVIGACLGVLVITRYLRVLQVQFETNIQHLANDEARATIGSIGSFGAKIIAAAVSTLVGVTAVNNHILPPLRIALVAGICIFIIVQTILHLRQRQEVAALQSA